MRPNRFRRISVDLRPYVVSVISAESGESQSNTVHEAIELFYPELGASLTHIAQGYLMKTERCGTNWHTCLFLPTLTAQQASLLTHCCISAVLRAPRNWTRLMSANGFIMTWLSNPWCFLVNFVLQNASVESIGVLC